MVNIYVDGDMILYKACSGCKKEIEWDDTVVSLYIEVPLMKTQIDTLLKYYCERVMENIKQYYNEDTYIIHLCFTDYGNCFRYKILPSYKGNRTKEKPIGYKQALDYVHKHYHCIEMESLEADDIIGIYMTTKDLKLADPRVMISGDKDFNSIPGYFYNFIQDTFTYNDERRANYWHLYQTLVGDMADNYKGCPKIGSVSAMKLLGDIDDPDNNPSWDIVKDAYEKQGLSEKEAIVQAQVARILRGEDIKKDLNDSTLVVRLWAPKGKRHKHFKINP